MKSLFSKSFAMKTGLFALMLSFFFALSAKAGGDGYAIYLNNKLLVSQSLAEPLDLKNLPLTAANMNDKLIIKFTQCNMPNKIGKNRKITIRDAGGKTVQEWKFADEDGTMTIAVKDILALQNKYDGSLSFYYSAEGLQKTQKLAAVQSLRKSNG